MANPLIKFQSQTLIYLTSFNCCEVGDIEDMYQRRPWLEKEGTICFYFSAEKELRAKKRI